MARSGKSILRNPLRASVAIIATLVIVVAILELTNTTHFFHAVKATSGTIPTISSSVSNSPPPNTSSQSNKTSGANSNNGSSSKTNLTGVAPPPTSSSQPPAVPFGSFVSNHHPDLSGSPAPSTEQSTCNTTPGASCYIEFTQDGVVKTLASQTTGTNGLASWSWDIKQAGFTEGSWQITAVSSLNGHTSSAKDSLALVVGP